MGTYDAMGRQNGARAQLAKARLNANSLTFAAENRAGARETQRENAARTAQSVHTIQSAGIGGFVLAEPVRFQVTFTVAPAVTCGASVITSAAASTQAEVSSLLVALGTKKPTDAGYAELIDQITDAQRRASRMPRGYAGVHRWLTDERDHFIGAYVHLHVEIDDATEEDITKTSMVHNLVFLGPAYKDLGAEVTADAALLSARPVNFGASS